MAFKTEPIKGWKIQEAYLHLYVAKEDLYGVGLCEVLAPWAEQDKAGRRRQQAEGAAVLAVRPPAQGSREARGGALVGLARQQSAERDLVTSDGPLQPRRARRTSRSRRSATPASRKTSSRSSTCGSR